MNLIPICTITRMCVISHLVAVSETYEYMVYSTKKGSIVILLSGQ